MMGVPFSFGWSPDAMAGWSPCHQCHKPGGPGDDIRYRTIKTDHPTFQHNGACLLTVPLCDGCAATADLEHEAERPTLAGGTEEL